MEADLTFSLGLPDYLREKVIERLKEEEAKIKAAGG